MTKSLFITFEGVEGSGKSTQIEKTKAYLRRSGYPVLLLREPGGTKVSESIREILLNRRYTGMVMETELLLYLAARAQIVREKIMPALKKGMIVICDRYEDSTLAYQGFGRGLDRRLIQKISHLLVRDRLVPDLTFLLDIPVKEGMRRGGRHDRMETQSLDFHNRVRRGFLCLAKQEPKRFVVLDSRQPKEAVFDQIRKRLEMALGK